MLKRKLRSTRSLAVCSCAWLTLVMHHSQVAWHLTMSLVGHM